MYTNRNFISIGTNCAPRLNMKEERITCIFDYLITGSYMDFDDNIWHKYTKEFSMKNINTIIKLEKFEPSDFYICDELEKISLTVDNSYRCVIHKDNLLISIHDVPRDSCDFSDLAAKLTRRLIRLKKYIEESKDEIIFVRIEYNKLGNTYIKNFIEFYDIVRCINPLIKIELRIVDIANSKELIDNKELPAYIKLFQLKDHEVKDVEWNPSWSNFNWDVVLN